MQVLLDYGRSSVAAELPDDAVVISPEEVAPLADEHGAFLHAVRGPLGSPPLREMVRPEDTVAIVIADITRPSHSERMVPWLLRELEHVPRSQFSLPLQPTSARRRRRSLRGTAPA